MRRLFGKKVGLALGGGGARGICHIGVLKVLDEENIPVDIIAGTSIGALIGGAYAAGIPPAELEKKFEEFVSSKDFQSSTIRAMEEVFSNEEKSVTQRIQRFLKNQYYLLQMMFRPGILSADVIQSMINYFIPDITIEECRIPFRAIATDLITGNEIVFSDGSLRDAITASSAVPGAIEPVSYRGTLLSDGGIVSIVPVNAVKEAGADIIIAVVVDRQSLLEEEPKTAKDVFYRACEITSAKLERYELALADVVIRPEVMNLHWTNFSRAATLVKEGEIATREHISTLHEKKALIPPLWKVIKGFTSKKKKQNLP